MPRASLTARVALGSAVASGLTALLAAIAALVFVDPLTLAAEDERLRTSAEIAVREIATSTRADAIDDEVAELAPVHIGLAIYANGQRVGGDASIELLPLGTCASRADASSRLCAAGTSALAAVTMAPQPRHAPATRLAACALAVLLAAGGAVLLGRAAARWALAPLTRLRLALASLTDADPSALQGEDTTIETAALRSTIADLVARLAVSIDAARRFSADAAHELKTPLTVLRAELGLLAEEELAPGVRATIEQLERRVAVVARLVERLLALSNASDRSRLAREPIAIEDIVGEVIARLDSHARERVVVQSAAQGMVHGDEALLVALVENMIDNALKFSTGAVVASIDETAEAVVVTVVDRGPGIPEEQRERVFEPFFRTPASRAGAQPGHGVGLALVRQIATAHGGTVAFVESEGAGAHLRLVLPPWSS